MSDHGFIQNADKAIFNVIWNGIKDETTVQNIITSQEQITFSPPKTGQTQKTSRLSIFLYRITEFSPMKNMLPNAESSRKRRELDLFFSLHYVVTPHTGNEEDDHILLGKILEVLTAAPIIGHMSPDSAADLRVSVDSLSLDELSKLWIAIGAPLKPSIGFTIAPVAVGHTLAGEAKTVSDAASPRTLSATSEKKNVKELYQTVFAEFTEQSEGWKKSNLFRKQWIGQDFKKVTNMTIDEMQTALNGLGDKLELNLPTVQFINPLNMLAEYYEHQATQLRGLGKVSQKQRENVEIVFQWVKDVKTLIEALSR